MLKQKCPSSSKAKTTSSDIEDRENERQMAWGQG